MSERIGWGVNTDSGSPAEQGQQLEAVEVEAAWSRLRDCESLALSRYPWV